MFGALHGGQVCGHFKLKSLIPVLFSLIEVSLGYGSDSLVLFHVCLCFVHSIVGENQEYLNMCEALVEATQSHSKSFKPD